MLAKTSRDQNLDFIVVMETVRPDFTAQFLGNICDNIDYEWYCLPYGKSCGIYFTRG